MSDSNLKSQIVGAQAYERLFVSGLFGQWAKVVADSVRIQAGDRVLDVATGTGILAREIVTRVGESGYIAGIDPNLGMLEVAKERASQVIWKQGIAESIPYPDNYFDVVVSQFGLMFFSDWDQSIREFIRVLKPSGRFSVAVWNSIDNIPGYTMELSLIERIAGQAAGDAVRAPFALGNRMELSDILISAGAVTIELETLSGTAKFPSIRTMIEAEVRGWLPIMGVHLAEEIIDQILREAEGEFAPYTTESGEVIFDISAHIATARRL